MSKKPDSDRNKKRGPDRSEARKAADRLGMSRTQLWRYMKLAEVPEDEFNAVLERNLDTTQKRATTSELVRLAQGKSDEPQPQGRRLKRCPHCGADLTDEVTP